MNDPILLAIHTIGAIKEISIAICHHSRAAYRGWRFMSPARFKFEIWFLGYRWRAVKSRLRFRWLVFLQSLRAR